MVSAVPSTTPTQAPFRVLKTKSSISMFRELLPYFWKSLHILKAKYICLSTPPYAREILWDQEYQLSMFNSGSIIKMCSFLLIPGKTDIQINSLPAKEIWQKKQPTLWGYRAGEPGCSQLLQLLSIKKTGQNSIFLAPTLDILKWIKTKWLSKEHERNSVEWLNVSLRFCVCFPLASKGSHGLSNKGMF